MSAQERRNMISNALRIQKAPLRESEADIEALTIAIENLVDRGDIQALSQAGIYLAGALNRALQG